MAGTTRNVKRQWSIQPNLASNSYEDAQWAMFEEHNKIITDLEVLRAAAQTGAVGLVNERRANNDLIRLWEIEVDADHELTRLWTTEVDGDLDEMNDYLSLLGEEDGVLGGDYALASAAAVTVAVTGRIRYRIDGIEYEFGPAATVALADDGDIDQNKYRSFRAEIDRLGVITLVADGDTQYTTEEESLLSLCSKAKTANTATIGYVVIQDTSGAFNIGTTNTNDAEGFNVYYERLPRRRASGLTASMGASIAAGSTPENYSTGTRDYMVSGVRVAQDAAEADKTFNDADTIGNAQFGGHLIVTNLANNATYALGSDGIAETVSAMTHADAAAATTQLAVIAALLPSMFCLVGTIVVQNNLGAEFTYGTDDINAADGTATFVDVVFATYNRAETDAVQDNQVNPPVVPDSVSATLVAASLANDVVPAAVLAAASTTAIDAASDMTAATIATAESQD